MWSEPEVGLHLGHRRLSILDLSPLGHQPMASRSGRFVVVFNGEIYNFRALRERLGGDFRGHSDTEVMLAAFEQWGIEAALREFLGMFALAVWDRSERTLHLIRDRFGKKPLYYGTLEHGGFWFASELKVGMALPGFSRTLNRDALASYMRLGCVPGEGCIFEAAAKVPAGGHVVVRDRRPAPATRFWSAAEAALGASAFRGTPQEGVEQLEGLLLDSVRLRMEADVPLGAFLSGGIDSSLTVALMQKLSSRPVQTFSIGFREPLYDEAPHARAVATHLQSEHTELYLPVDEAAAVVPLLPRMYDEPFGDSSQIPMYLVSKLARQSVTVALSGDGGDELFLGYQRYAAARLGWKRFPLPLRRLLGGLLGLVPDRLWSTALQRLQPLLPGKLAQFKLYNKLPRLQRLLSARSFSDFYLGLLSQWSRPQELVSGGRELPLFYSDPAAARAFPDLEQWMAVGDASTYLTDDILTKVDRASMAVSLEARTPLLDHRIYEFACGLPTEWRREKWPLREVLSRYVPRPLWERPKMGFGVPIDSWLRGSLRSWADDLLEPGLLRRQGFLDAELVSRVWRDHRDGRATDHLRLWNVLMFQSWLQHWKPG